MEILNTKLSVRNITKTFDDKTVLHNVSFDLHEGEFLSILGPSGCGKTTLLRILIGLEKADSGEILKNDTDISNLKSIERGMQGKQMCVRPLGAIINSERSIPVIVVRTCMLIGLFTRRVKQFCFAQPIIFIH